MCGQNRIKGNLDEEKRNIIENYQVERSGVGVCSHVIISDRYALTTANCWEAGLILSDGNVYDSDREKFRFIIRQDTDFEEVMNVKRFWFNPWRLWQRSQPSTINFQPAYYDIVIMEFGNLHCITQYYA